MAILAYAEFYLTDKKAGHTSLLLKKNGTNKRIALNKLKALRRQVMDEQPAERSLFEEFFAKWEKRVKAGRVH